MEAKKTKNPKNPTKRQRINDVVEQLMDTFDELGVSAEVFGTAAAETIFQIGHRAGDECGFDSAYDTGFKAAAQAARLPGVKSMIAKQQAAQAKAAA